MPQQKLKNLINIGIIIILSLAYFHISLAYDFRQNSGLDATGDAAGFEIGANATPLNVIIGDVLYTVLSLVGIAFLAYLLYGSYTWMTSRGNEEKVKAATNTLVNSIIGLIVTLAAYALTYLIVSQFWP
ncbi:MAG: pilin [Patescibacteria group bacterium]